MIPELIGVILSCCNGFFLVRENFIKFAVSALWIKLEDFQLGLAHGIFDPARVSELWPEQATSAFQNF